MKRKAIGKTSAPLSFNDQVNIIPTWDNNDEMILNLYGLKKSMSSIIPTK